MLIIETGEEIVKCAGRQGTIHFVPSSHGIIPTGRGLLNPSGLLEVVAKNHAEFGGWA